MPVINLEFRCREIPSDELNSSAAKRHRRSRSPNICRLAIATARSIWSNLELRCRENAAGFRFASSAQAPRHAGIFRSLQIVGKHYRLCGGEGRIRTPETLARFEGRGEVWPSIQPSNKQKSRRERQVAPLYRTKNSMLFPYRFANSANSIMSIRRSPDSHFETYD